MDLRNLQSKHCLTNYTRERCLQILSEGGPASIGDYKSCGGGNLSRKNESWAENDQRYRNSNNSLPAKHHAVSLKIYIAQV